MTKKQRILWTERPTGAVMGTGSLGPKYYLLPLLCYDILNNTTMERHHQTKFNTSQVKYDL